MDRGRAKNKTLLLKGIAHLILMLSRVCLLTFVSIWVRLMGHRNGSTHSTGHTPNQETPDRYNILPPCKSPKRLKDIPKIPQRVQVPLHPFAPIHWTPKATYWVCDRGRWPRSLRSLRLWTRRRTECVFSVLNTASEETRRRRGLAFVHRMTNDHPRDWVSFSG